MNVAYKFYRIRREPSDAIYPDGRTFAYVYFFNTELADEEVIDAETREKKTVSVFKKRDTVAEKVYTFDILLSQEDLCSILDKELKTYGEPTAFQKTDKRKLDAKKPVSFDVKDKV